MGSEIRIHTPEGQALYSVQDYLRFEAVKSLSTLGGCLLIMPDEIYDVTRLERDSIITFTHNVGSGFSTTWAFFLRRLRRTPGVLTLSGDGCKVMLKDRIVAYYAHTDETDRTDQVDDFAKEIVRENLGTQAATARDVSTYLAVAPDITQGPSLSKAYAWQNVLTTIEGLQGAALLQGTKIYFDVVPQLSTDLLVRFTFNTYLDQPGSDRTGVSSYEKMIFSEARGNLIDPMVEYDWRDRPTVAYGLGQGEGDDRTLQIAFADSHDSTPWSRIETYVDARMSETANAVYQEARRALAEHGPRIFFRGEAIDTDGSRFGIHWNWGDRVVGEYEGSEFDCLIDAVHVTLVPGEPLAITAKLEYEGLIA